MSDSAADQPGAAGVYTRYVALGDSQTEGVGDGDDLTGVRGWADRLAEKLAAVDPGVQYANLAVRGKLAHQVRAEQLDAAMALRPDLATVMAGVNDLLRPGFDADEVGGHLDAMFGALTSIGAVVATATVPDIARITPLARPLSGRVNALNQRVRESAARHGVIVAETAHHAVVTDPRIWSRDRLHAGPIGHQRIADALAQALNLPGADSSWTEPLWPILPPRGRAETIRTELHWVATFLGPWLGRRLTGRSSGDGRIAKRPRLLPVRDAMEIQHIANQP
ncbi:SGNH/GDSL hydrolase family protein [Nocardia inohanensis]|uniref:SGNH/GDSL hydrolase family protein n=1 Tax=Nocardia inohanensis TaxID=209246 RepID=UPI0008364B7D|nr:SGNH/GDSL hydrolase family protein [Nocardia inohanensis]